MITAHGYMGATVTFDGQWVSITRHGAQRMTHGRGEKQLHISQISAVQMKPPAMLTNGFIQFTIAGGMERQSQKGGRTYQAAKDENSVIFLKKHYPEFVQLRDAVAEAIGRAHMPQPQAPQQTTGPSVPQQIQELWDMHQRGMLTRKQYDAQVARLSQ
ncbi:DUF4429 domain-containing protein [Nocardiopsis alba]|uniref:DUF4429 domain-containing protein n=2 Tax=Nocardiopsis alba TaxID=53437 RepID=A0A7K2IL88_9ACTN|nr:DUF4429 domain-containing protein [Nocardiopsis alba]